MQAIPQDPQAKAIQQFEVEADAAREREAAPYRDWLTSYVILELEESQRNGQLTLKVPSEAPPNASRC